jgi:hypothetical protein
METTSSKAAARWAVHRFLLQRCDRPGLLALIHPIRLEQIGVELREPLEGLGVGAAGEELAQGGDGLGADRVGAPPG